MPVAASKGTTVNLLVAVTTGTSIPASVPNTSNSPRVHVRGAGTITGGTLIIEEALDPNYTGLWSQLQSIVLTTLTANAELVIHITGTIGAIRARLSANVTGGGTVSVDLVSN